MRFYQILSVVVFIITICYALKATPAHAQFQPPDNVTLTMYRLTSDGSILKDENTNQPIPCKKDDTFYGCTTITDNATYAYPFDTSTITIGIDGRGGPDNARYAYPYLWDVIPQELDMNGSQGNKPLAAVAAQAIAARTYIYQRITYSDQYGTPNNSTQFHVFLPYRYAILTTVQQERVQAATASRVYMSEAGSTYPIEALYGADNPANTVEGNRPYLKSVADPISAGYGVVDGTANGGMSSKGASRWAFGHTSSRGPVSADHPNYPHDLQGFGDFWRVSFARAEQILTHYYTGIHIRDANNGNQVVTPTDRWLPLDLRAPRSLCTGSLALLQVRVQNSGVSLWEENAAAVHLDDTGSGPSAAAIDAQVVIPQRLAPGDDALVLLSLRPTTSGQTTYALDLSRFGQRFSNQNPAWPRHPFAIAAIDCPYSAHLPMVQGDSTATTPSE
jgi:hypothetical protein